MKRLAVTGLLVALFGSAVWLARTDGGGASAHTPPPSREAETVHASPPGHRGTGDGYEVKVRLTQALGEARLDVPQAKTGLALLSAHWRKMQLPWAKLPPEAARLAFTLALRTSQDEEKQWAVPQADGGLWTPDVRTWNMSEGSYDQREGIFAPTPSTIAFKLTVPAAARLDFATAVVLPTTRATTFTVIAAGGPSGDETVCTRVVEGRDAERWIDASCSLEKFAGQRVELRLVTSGGEPDRPGLAMWGDPTVLARGSTALPYNVLWVVIDALRPDVPASFHDDAEDEKKRHAPHEPLDALLPKIPGLTPVIDELATHGVRFMHAYSNATWTRPGTLAMISGERASELGIDPLPWVVTDQGLSRYYRGAPPLTPLSLRSAGASTRAFVNNYFMVGYAAVGVDMGFERVDDERFRTLDTRAITDRATSWIKDHGDDRFFLFVNYNSPHEPWDPPARFEARVPPPPAGPRETVPRKYMAEAAKDDAALGELLQALEAVHARERTIIVVCADHGETLSAAHTGKTKQDHMNVRFHHAVTNYEETSRIPILVVLPHVLPEGAKVMSRVRLIDIAPTLLDLEGLPADAKMRGKSLVPLTRGEKEPEERDVVTEGRGITALIHGRYRLMVREGGQQDITVGDKELHVPEELYDLEDDPGERKNLAKERPEIVAELRARLDAARKGIPVAGTPESLAPAAPSGDDGTLRVRFAGAGAAHRIAGALTWAPGTRVEVVPVGVAKEALRVEGARIDLSLVTSASAAVGFDVKVEPPSADVTWELSFDDAAWPRDHVFVGPFGLFDAASARGLVGDEARRAAASSEVPRIDPVRDLGMFVVRSGTSDAPPAREKTGAGAEEMNRILKQWGYAHDPVK